MQLAEKMGVTDRAVSKWENGRSLPDSSIMLDLCKELGISVNDLLSGEVVTMENYNKELEKNLAWGVAGKKLSDVNDAIADRRKKTVELVRQRLAPRKVSK